MFGENILVTKYYSLNYSNNKGNALFLILIAVALFAALSYAVTKSSKGSGTIDKEKAIIEAAQIMEYSAYLESTYTRMVLLGTPRNQIKYAENSAVSRTDECISGTGCLFVSEGGGYSL